MKWILKEYFKDLFKNLILNYLFSSKEVKKWKNILLCIKWRKIYYLGIINKGSEVTIVKSKSSLGNIDRPKEKIKVVTLLSEKEATLFTENYIAKIIKKGYEEYHVKKIKPGITEKDVLKLIDNLKLPAVVKNVFLQENVPRTQIIFILLIHFLIWIKKSNLYMETD